MALLRQISRCAHLSWIVLVALAMPCAASASDVAAAAEEAPRLASELELDLARRPEPYLVIDLGLRRLEVRLKGRSVAEFPLDAASALRLADWPHAAEPLWVPTVLHVARRPMSGRLLQLPGELRDLSADETAESPAEDAPAAAPTAAPDVMPPPPESYVVETREGWSLEFGRSAEPPGLFARWWQATRTGWSRSAERSGDGDRLRLALSPEAAAHLHHLFRAGTPILLVASENGP